MSREAWIAGFPSRYGGADTEMDHQIDLFLQHGVDVHLVPMFDCDADMKRDVIKRGCRVHAYRPDVFEGKVVLSWCNGNFLEKLPSLIYAGRPARIIWFNCMTWLFEREKEAHDRGWIDDFGFVSQFQRDLLLPKLEALRPVRALNYRPFFNLERFPFRYPAWDGQYAVGRISRDDADKFSDDTWAIFDRVEVPRHLRKAVHVLGFGPHALRRIGLPPDRMNATLWAPQQISATRFFSTLQTMIHKTGGSRESYCRVVVEAYAHGVVPIVEDAFAFAELVVDGETGFRTNSSEEMSEIAGMLAADPALHRRVAHNGRDHLATLCSANECWKSWDSILI